MDATPIEITPRDNQEIESLKGIFNENAKIEPVKDGFKVITTLKDGIAEGGQNIEIQLSRMKPQVKIHDDQGTDTVNCFEVKSLSVNESDITKNLNQLFLVPQNEHGYSNHQFKPGKHPLNDHLLETSGSGAVPTKKGEGMIFITVFKNADDLLMTFHEDGHLNDPNMFTDFITGGVYVELQDNIGNHDLILHQSKSTQEKALTTWKSVVHHEIRASKNALAKIKYLSKLNTNLFKDGKESGFMRAKKTFTYQIINLLNISGGWYKNQLSNHELTELTSLD